ncbi:MAG: glycerol-3-phosphate acyltransferase [Verrucomicrobia bacterium]|nr:glycerol-3-phosphate acyltransferase [Verrucomicrobiota bacterium]
MSATASSLALGWLPALGVLGAYLLGCFNTGYYLVRWRTGQDLRATGSGNAGARNVSRLLGPWAFGATVLGDMGKGALAVAGIRLLGWDDPVAALAAVAVTAGHTWPVQLGFRGGKGVATSYGALLVFDPLVAGLMLGACALLLAATRRFTLGALSAFALAPLLAAAAGHRLPEIALLVPLSALVILTHRANLRAELANGAAAPPDPP